MSDTPHTQKVQVDNLGKPWHYAYKELYNHACEQEKEINQLKADFVNITGRYMKENAKLKTLLNQIRNEPKLWKSGRAGRQDQYAGMPPFVPMIDAIMKQHLDEGGTPT